ncbi:MAG: hypothetical protein J5859_01635, partial [Clostridia bacterium]|nr:hypothetical protein [Clostridia bacterium]
MKKILVFLLALMFSMTGFTAFADGYRDLSEALDTAFESDGLILTETGFPEISVEDFEFPDDMWEAVGMEKPADAVSELAGEFSGTVFTWLSLSPAGNSGLLSIGGRTGICYYDGTYRILYPSSKRGTADTNGNLAKVFSIPIQRLIGEEGIVYSPDGRYAAIYNIEYVLIKAQFIFDPVIIDLSTGEMILTATYANKVRDEGMGAVSTAAFSADGRYFYYMLYGNTAAFKTALYRYDIAEDTTELCYSGSDLNYYPYLSETGSGAFAILRDARRSSEFTGITYIRNDNGSWSGKEYSFDLPMQYFYSNRLLASRDSGWAVIPGRTMMNQSGSWYAFQAVRPDEGFAGLGQYVTVSKEGGEVCAYTAEELDALFAGFTDETAFDREMPFQAILTA